MYDNVSKGVPVDEQAASRADLGLLQATMVPPRHELQLASDLLSTVHTRTTAIAAAHMRLTSALVAICFSSSQALLPLLHGLYFEHSQGGQTFASVLSSFVDACMDSVHTEAREGAVDAVHALARLTSSGHGTPVNCALALSPLPVVRALSCSEGSAKPAGLLTQKREVRTARAPRPAYRFLLCIRMRQRGACACRWCNENELHPRLELRPHDALLSFAARTRLQCDPGTRTFRQPRQHTQDQHSPGMATSNIVDCFKYALVSTLSLHNCTEAPRAAAAAAELLAFSYEQQASLVSFLLLPTALGLAKPLPPPGVDASVRAAPLLLEPFL